ncbi:MAG: GreA/GreB family elongation factor, partial [Chromatiales bacterium]
EIDHRIRYLQKRLPDLKVVTGVPDNPEQVFFGAWVTIEDSEGTERTYRIVGPDEFDEAPGYISMDSPVARALLKRHLDDEVRLETPGGVHTVWITQIRYEENSAT